MKIELQEETGIGTSKFIEIGSKSHHEFCEFLINN